MTSRPVVTKADGGQSFAITLGSWSNTYPIDCLEQHLNFYRRLRDRKRGTFAKHYEPTVRALEDFAQRKE